MMNEQEFNKLSKLEVQALCLNTLIESDAWYGFTGDYDEMYVEYIAGNHVTACSLKCFKKFTYDDYLILLQIAGKGEE